MSLTAESRQNATESWQRKPVQELDRKCATQQVIQTDREECKQETQRKHMEVCVDYCSESSSNLIKCESSVIPAGIRRQNVSILALESISMISMTYQYQSLLHYRALDAPAPQ